MKKISPINGHILIEPVKHDDFIATQHDSYQEIGTVIEVSKDIEANLAEKAMPSDYLVGKRIYFDSWLAVKFPKEGTQDEYFWLVKWEDVRAIEHEQQISK